MSDYVDSDFQLSDDDEDLDADNPDEEETGRGRHGCKEGKILIGS
jgi:hypothetical protein